MNFGKFAALLIIAASMGFVTCTAWAQKGCQYNGVVYSGGSFTCQAGYGYTCNDGSWDILKTSCSTRPHETGTKEEAEIAKGVCGCTTDEKNLCYAAGQICAAEGDSRNCTKKCK